jgi:hypothetical protein
MNRTLLVACFAMWLALGACSASELSEQTQIVVTVDSDLKVPAEIDRLRIEITGNGSAPVAEADLTSDPLPRTLGLVHGGGPLGPITIKVSGLLGSSTVVERELVTSFVKNTTSLISVELESACKNVFCDDGATCVAGVCQGIPVVDPDDQPDGGSGPGQDAGGDGDGDAGGDAATGNPGGAPTCQIELPVAGDVYQTDKTIPLQGSCSDPESGALSNLVWSSDVDGVLDSSARLTSTGAHVLSLCATDPRDASVKVCDTVSIEATLTAQPAVSITSVTQGNSSTQPFADHPAVEFAGTASGAGITVSWIDSLQGEVGDSTSASITSPVIGRHTVSFTVVDRSGAKATATADYVVLGNGRDSLVDAFGALNDTLAGAGGASVLCLGEDAGGRAYAGNTQSELYEFDGGNPAVAGSVAVDNPPLQSSVRDIFIAEQASLAYLATGDGLTVCNYIALTGIAAVCTTYSGSDLPSSVVLSVLRMTATDDNEYLLVGTSKGLMISSSLSGSDNGEKKLEERSINAMVAASGVAWLATDNGLYRYNPATDVTFHSTQSSGAPSNTMNGVAVDSTGQVWVATSNGLGRFAPAQLQNPWRVYRTQNGLPTNLLNDVLVHHVTIDDVARDVVWVASNVGVSRLDPALGSFMNLGVDDGVPGVPVVDLLLLDDGSKLLATGAGVARYVGP